MKNEQRLEDIDYNRFAEKILLLLQSNKPYDFLISDVVLLIQQETLIESIGIRLQDGLDYPYFYNNGFEQKFIEMEMYLCSRSQNGHIARDANGMPYLECMCGNVISGRTDASLPFFTEGGSFWTNSTTDLLASTTEEERLRDTRNQCNRAGYESVALIPIKNDMAIYGLLQLNDRRMGMFSLEFIKLMEWVASSVGILFDFAGVRVELAKKSLEITKHYPSRRCGSIKAGR